MRRRDFIKGTGVAIAGGLMVGPEALTQDPRPSANDKFQIGVIGCNGMGWSNTNSFLKMSDVDLLGICDVDNSVIQKRLSSYK